MILKRQASKRSLAGKNGVNPTNLVERVTTSLRKVRLALKARFYYVCLSALSELHDGWFQALPMRMRLFSLRVKTLSGLKARS